MATILHLANQGLLHKLEAGLSWREQEERLIYVLPEAMAWMRDVLPIEESNWGSEISPLEQLDSFLIDYCAGKELAYERQFRPIRHIADGIWELKTVDVRLFGWFYRKDLFICSAGNIKWKIKESGLVHGYRSEAAGRRDHLGLEEPKFVPGDNPNDVISAFYYAAP